MHGSTRLKQLGREFLVELRACLAGWVKGHGLAGSTPIPAPSVEEAGPFAYENWRRYIAGAPTHHAYECPLYTDARITGELGLGPYKLLNAVPSEDGRGRARPAVYLQVEDHSPGEFRAPRMDRTDIERYHGGDLRDEIAALISLSLGIRVAPGATSRLFWPGGEPRGRPSASEVLETPAIPVRGTRPLIPSALRTVALCDAVMLQRFPEVLPEAANVLVRAARSYQQGLWVAEAEPQLAWLFFVSAIETAAQYWWRGPLDDLQILRENKPELVATIEKGGDEVLAAVAGEFGPVMRATYKFNEFVKRYLPPPPEKRPPEWIQVAWDWNRGLKKAVAQVYLYRSKALHEARPYPVPMCDAPMHESTWEAAAERPIPGAMATRGGVWTPDAALLNLATFEYIVRGALNAWWGELSISQGSAL